jgi:hypothetical protein
MSVIIPGARSEAFESAMFVAIFVAPGTME